MSRPNLVPAVAVRRERLVLIIIIRFKGYLDCIFILNKEINILELYILAQFGITRVEIEFFNTSENDMRRQIFMYKLTLRDEGPGSKQG